MHACNATNQRQTGRQTATNRRDVRLRTNLFAASCAAFRLIASSPSSSEPPASILSPEISPLQGGIVRRSRTKSVRERHMTLARNPRRVVCTCTTPHGHAPSPILSSDSLRKGVSGRQAQCLPEMSVLPRDRICLSASLMRANSNWLMLTSMAVKLFVFFHSPRL